MAKKLLDKNNIIPYLMSLVSVVIVTLFSELIKRHVEPANLVMFYLGAVVFIAIRWGQWPAVVTSILSVLAFDFFLVRPYLTFSIDDLQYLFTFGAFSIVGIVVSTLASRVRQQEIQRETEKLQTVILNSISHDLKTPLASITGSLTALLDKGAVLDEKNIEVLIKNAFEETQYLNGLVRNLLDMARVDAGALKISRRPCDLRDVINSALEQLREKIDSRNININIPEDFPEVPMDFSFMVKVVHNIIDNAVKYSPAGSPVEIKAGPYPKGVKIEFIDAGPGIPEDDLRKIFEKFYRAGHLPQVKGTGLGLSICRAIVEAHQGEIFASNNPDRGATLTIILPLEK